MTTLKTVTMAAVLFVGGASLGMAQNGLPTGGYGAYPGYGYSYGYAAAPLYNYAAPVADLAPPAYGYAAPGYGYAAPIVAPGQAGTTVVIVTPSPAYTAPPVTTGYYGAPVVSQPIYGYAPGYGYTPGSWNRGYWAVTAGGAAYGAA